MHLCFVPGVIDTLVFVWFSCFLDLALGGPPQLGE
jgi:hypothetical protein